MKAVRDLFPGELRQNKRRPREFAETPYNFWYIWIQPHKKNYGISIRGRPERYKESSFEKFKPYRGSYSRFYLQNESEVPEALRLISRAKSL